MCNLYRMTRTADEIAHLFDVRLAAGGANAAEEVYPGYPGLVVAEGELRSMHWGFPLSLHGQHGQKLKPKPVNNARTDKLTGPFWRASFERRRCLIPISAYAEAEGPKGRKTRSWLSMPDGEPFAAAGVWRWSDEWGEVYSMIVTDAAGKAAEVHTRMPALIPKAEWRTFLEAQPKRAYALCRPYEGELELDRTRQLWGGAWPD
jgi:putative SOS response-associated peptidase YedK